MAVPVRGAGTRRWEALDVAFFTYLSVVLVLILVLGVGLGNIEDPWYWAGYHLALAGLGLLARTLPRIWDHPVSRFLRWWYPAILFFFCFTAIGEMITLVRPDFIDEGLLEWERRVFGVLWTPFLQQYASVWLTEVMYFCYTSYYFFVPGVGFPLYLRAKGRLGTAEGEPFREFLFAVSLTFWVCYLHFLLTPAAGPVFWDGYPVPVLSPPGGPITALERWLFGHGAIVGGAFPSSHVAVAVVATGYAVRERVAPLFFIPVCVGLAVSTMYHGYHYGLDVMYGVVIGGVMLKAAPVLFRLYEGEQPVQGAAVDLAQRA